MKSRERIDAALNHRQPDRVPVDFGGTTVSGIAVSLVAKLRREFGLKEKPIKIIEAMQMLGEIDDELRVCLGVDTITPITTQNIFGVKNDSWKEWTLFDGTKVLVPEGFNTTPNKNGSIFQYPQGDKSVPASMEMPQNGYYFDTIVRQHEIDDDNLNPEDNLEEFMLLNDEQLRSIENTVSKLYHETDYAIVGVPGLSALGDIALITAPALKYPKGIRDLEEWYISILLRRDYIKEVFDRQTDLALKNLKNYKEAVGDKVCAVFICGTDFGTQITPFYANEVFYDVYYPYYKKVNDWIHSNTVWKTMKHSCGAIEPLIEPLIQAGFDILNPVQCSAVNMDPKILKERYGKSITFWGGGVDTQKTLPFGTPQEVEEEVKSRIDVFNKDGGFVFGAIHNIQADVPVENVIAMFEALKT